MYVHHCTTTYLLPNLDPGCTQRCLQKGLWKCNRQRGPHPQAQTFCTHLASISRQQIHGSIQKCNPSHLRGWHHVPTLSSYICLHCRLSREVSCSIYLHNVDIADDECHAQEAGRCTLPSLLNLEGQHHRHRNQEGCMALSHLDLQGQPPHSLFYLPGAQLGLWRLCNQWQTGQVTHSP